MSPRRVSVLLLVATLIVTLRSQAPDLGAARANMLLVREQAIGSNDAKFINDLDSLDFENMPQKTSGNVNLQLAPDHQPPVSCQLVQIVHLLKHPGCQSKAIASFACAGSCPSYVKVKTHAPVNCLCRSCTDLGRENLRAQELVDALAKEEPVESIPSGEAIQGAN